MQDSAAVEAVRQALGTVGVLLPVSFATTPPIELQRDAVRALERAGYRAGWTNEVVGGKDALVQLALLLAATDRMAFGTSIANIWARPAPTMHAAAAQLSEAYPGRFVLGLGVGLPAQAAGVGREFGRPRSTLRGYLELMNAPTAPPAADASYPCVVGANGPAMLGVARDSADGAIPAMVPADFTRDARQTLGPDKLLIVLAPSTAADPMTTVSTVREHLDAGADHVIVNVPRDGDYATGVDQLVRLAPALINPS